MVSRITLVALPFVISGSIAQAVTLSTPHVDLLPGQRSKCVVTNVGTTPAEVTVKLFDPNGVHVEPAGDLCIGFRPILDPQEMMLCPSVGRRGGVLRDSTVEQERPRSARSHRQQQRPRRCGGSGHGQVTPPPAASGRRRAGTLTTGPAAIRPHAGGGSGRVRLQGLNGTSRHIRSITLAFPPCAG